MKNKEFNRRPSQEEIDKEIDDLLNGRPTCEDVSHLRYNVICGTELGPEDPEDWDW